MDKITLIRQALTRRGVGSSPTEQQVIDVLSTFPLGPTHGVPPQSDDRRDYHTAIMLMTSEHREQLGLPSRREPGATVAALTPREHIESPGARETLALTPGLLPGVKLQIRVHALVCRNDDGMLSDGGPGETSAELATRISDTIAEANKIYAGSDIELLFSPGSDLEIRNDTRLNQDFVVPLADRPKLSQQPPLTEEQISALAGGPWSTDAYRKEVAREYPGRMVLLFAEGTTYHFATAPSLENGWRWCKKCQVMFYQSPSGSRCPTGGSHDGSASGLYTMIIGGGDGLDTQSDWHRCSKCQGLAFGGNGVGVCPAGQGHQLAGSLDYHVLRSHADVDPSLQTNWRWCSKCQGMAFAAGICPAGGQHDFAASGAYAMAFEHAAVARWELSSPSYGGFSAGDSEFVKLSAELGTNAPDYATFLAHETGHYLHLSHPFLEVKLEPADDALTDADKIAKLKTKIRDLLQGERNQGASVAESVRILDADRSEVSDTPPDDGGALLELLNRQADHTNACGAIGTVNVTFQDGASVSYTPDRSLVMSYFKGCLNFKQHFSPDQVRLMRAALIEQNRWDLIATQLGDAGRVAASLWVVDDQGNQASYKELGPFLSWTPLNYAGNRIVWRGDDNRISLWIVDDKGNQVSYKEYGPFPDWTPLNYANGRILWRGPENRISLWVVDDKGNQVSYKEHGPFSGWRPLNYANNRILWRGNDNSISLWVVDDKGNQVSYTAHGPFSGWTPLNYSNNRILWRGDDNSISLWVVDNNGNQVSYIAHGPFSGWTPLNYANNRILWRGPENRISLWVVDDKGNQVSYKEYGPFSGWTPLHYADSRILWRGVR